MTTTISADLDDYLWRVVEPTVRAAGGFGWSAHCGQYVADWVRRREGWDPLSRVIAVDSVYAARQVIAGLGGTLPAAVTRLLDREPLPALQAQIGDIVHLPGTRGVGGALGLCAGRLTWMLGGVSLTAVETTRCDLCWRIG